MKSRVHVIAAAAATAASGILVDGALAAPINIVSHPGDFEASYQQNGTNSGNDAAADDTYAAREGGTQGDELRIGYTSGSGGIKFSAVYYFPLPDVNPSDIVGANFMTSSVPDDSTSAVRPGHNVDLWALGFDNNNPPITFGAPNADAAAEDYYYDSNDPDLGAGAEPGVHRSNLRIQDNFMTPDDFVPNGGAAITKSTDATADAALLAYIQSLYADPNFVPGESDLILRLNGEFMDVGSTGTRRFNVSSAGVTDGDGSATTDPGAVLPTLTLEMIPEPGAVGLAGLAGIAALLKRRR